MSAISLKNLLENFTTLADEGKEYFLQIAQKQMIELRRYKIAERVKEAEENYKAGKVSTGNLDDLLKDLNNDLIYLDNKFKRKYKKRISADVDLKSKFITSLIAFSKNSFDTKLKTHKLSGTLKGCWAFL